MFQNLKNNYPTRLLIIFLILIAFTSIDIKITPAQSNADGWSTPINLSNSGSTTDPQMVVDSNGIFHVIWIDEFDGYVYTQSLDGEQWSTPVPLALPFQTEDSPPLLLANTIGNVHAFWTDQEDVMYYSWVLGAEFGNPSAWQGAVGLAESALDLDAVIDSEGNLHMIYVRALDTEQFPAGIYYRRSIDGGQSWSNAVSLYQSKYFRSLDRENAHAQISTTSVDGNAHVYAAWDDRSIRRVYMAKSIDEGISWQEPLEIIGSGSDPGITPYNFILSPEGTTILGLIHMGKPGAYCTQDAYLSTDQGVTWLELNPAIHDIVGCPQENRFFILENGLTILHSIIQDQVYLTAWDGQNWSDPQKQSALFSFINQVNNESVAFGCRTINRVGEKFYVVGCEANELGDIWIASRIAGTFPEWYPSPVIWSQIDQITDGQDPILTPILLADGEGLLHAIWLQSSEDNPQISTRYSRIFDGDWSVPVPILDTFEESISSQSAVIDSRGRILIVLSSQTSGAIYFSWANASDAENPSEWAQSQIISKSDLFSISPFISIDESGTIYVIYAVPINEGRGIYLTQSSDEGISWSKPSQIFDARAQGWDIVTSPKLIATDKSLNLFFARHRLSNQGRVTELYHVRSNSEGVTWSDPELVSESTPIWTDIIAVEGSTIQRAWLEKLDGFLLFSDQISDDLGITWEAPVNITNFSTVDGTVSLAKAPDNKLHMIHIGEDFNNNQRLIHWLWNEQSWNLEEEILLASPVGSRVKSISVAINNSGELAVLYSNSHVDGSEADLTESLNFIQKQLLLALQIATPTPVAIEQATPPHVTEETQITLEPVTPTVTMTVTNSTINGNAITPQPPTTGISGYRGLIIGGIISIIVVTIPLGLYTRRLLTKENR